MQGNIYVGFAEEEHENMAHQEVSHHKEVAIEEEDMDYYCRQFAKFMQTQPQRKYNLRSLKKRTREPKQQGEDVPQVVPPTPDKGEGKIHLDPPKTGVSTNKERNGPKGHTEKEAPSLLTTTSGKGEGTKHGDAEKAQHTFNLQKELEKVKIHVPLTELLKQPHYKAQVSKFMHPTGSAPSHNSLNL